jgi:glycosyltransferase involved in cell wall biosynthesis
MPTRVLLMISSMRGGGSEQQTLSLLRRLDRSRFSPQLYVTQRAGELLARVPDDVPIHSFDDLAQKPGFYFPGRLMRRQIRHLRQLLEREAIEVIYDRTFHMTLIAGPAGRATGTPRVSTIVSPPQYALPLVESRFVALKRRRLAKAYRRSHAVVAVSRHAADSAEQYYRLPRHSVRVIHNPVDVGELQAAASEGGPQRDSRITLVCVGRMSEEKGHRDLMDAIIATQSRWPKDAPPLRLWIVGDGPLRSELESQWTSGASQHSVEFLGTQRNPAPWIAAADALVLPSHFEGMPNAVLEAMALGTPVIATRAGGITELERDEPTMLWAGAGHPMSLADAIMQLQQDRESAAQRADNAAAMIKEHHDVGRATRAIEEVLQQACKKSPIAPRS